MIEKILERARAELFNLTFHKSERCKGFNDGIHTVMKIVQEVAKEYEQKKTYFISLEGCDDTTTFEMELTTQECLFLKRVSELANKTSSYGCMPRMYVSRTERYWEEE